MYSVHFLFNMYSAQLTHCKQWIVLGITFSNVYPTYQIGFVGKVQARKNFLRSLAKTFKNTFPHPRAHINTTVRARVIVLSVILKTPRRPLYSRNGLDHSLIKSTQFDWRSVVHRPQYMIIFS